MKKVILNKSYGGFMPSHDAYKLYAEKTGQELYCYTMKFERAEGLGKAKTTYVLHSEPSSIFDTYTTKYQGETTEKLDCVLDLDAKFREDPVLIEVIEQLGDKANSRMSNFKIVEIPDDLVYTVDNYDGIETLHQKVQEW